jgi:hypothetical protein
MVRRLVLRIIPLGLMATILTIGLECGQQGWTTFPTG